MKFRLTFEIDRQRYTKEIEGELNDGIIKFEIDNNTDNDLKLIKLEY